MSGPVMAALSKQLFGVLKSLQHQAAADVNLTVEQRITSLIKDEISATVSGSGRLGVESIADSVEGFSSVKQFRVNNDWMGGSYTYKELSPETVKRKFFYHRNAGGREYPLKFQNYYGPTKEKSLVSLLSELGNQANIAETLFMAFGGLQFKRGYELGRYTPDQRLYDAQAQRRRNVRV